MKTQKVSEAANLTLAGMTPVKGVAVDAAQPNDTPIRSKVVQEVPTTKAGIAPIIRTDYK